MKFNFAPYNDSFSENDNFYKLLYKPGFEVQSRELNSMQSMMQSQIASIGNHLFKNGAKISGCSSSFVQYDYVRLNDSYNDVNVLLKPYNNKKINLVGAVSGVEATIIDVTELSKDDAPCLIVIYTKTGVDNIQSTFIPGEDIHFKDENKVTVYNATVRCPSCPENTTADTIPPIGKSLIFTIADGIFYYNSYFVTLQNHHIIIEKYLTKDENNNIISDRTYRVGLTVIESIITVQEDESLYDPHLGYPNYAAEGADRYKIEMLLDIRPYTENGDDTSFITLAKVRQNNTVEYKKDDTEYAEIMKELARRTYESSGNFAYVPWKAYFLNEKKKNQTDNKGWTTSGKDENFVAVVSPGIGYVKGSRVANQSDNIVTNRKARDTKKLRGGATSIQECTNITVTVTGNISWLNHTGSSTLSDQVFNILDDTSTSIGSFKVYDIYKVGDKLYKLYLYDLTMVSGKLLSAGKTVKTNDSSFNGTVTGVLNIENANNTSLLFPLEYSSIKTIRDNDNNNNGNTSVEVRRRLTGVLDSNGSITFTSATNESFISPLSANPICWVGANPTGVLINLVSSLYSYSNNTLTLNLGAGNSGKNVSIVISVAKTSQLEKTKTLTRHSYTTSTKPSNDINSVFTLPHADGYKLESVKVVSISDPEINEDITSEYTFDNGQTDNFYTASKLTRNKARVFNNDNRIIVTYYYFEHSGTAPFFTVDSYSQLVNDPELDLEYSDIPTYTNKNGVVHRLSEFIDYRSIKLTTVNTNALLPAFNSTVIFDVEYYLPRADLLLVDEDNTFYFKEGIANDNPTLPTIDENAMALYEVHIAAYTYSLDDITVKYIDNKSFSMKDIGRLFKRVENIEYAISLSMLEQQTLNMSTKDTNGFDRYKNGFLVDNFKGYYASDVNNIDFKAALDRSKGYLRPQFKQNNIRMVFNPLESSNIVQFGNMAITKFEHDLFIQNPYATSTLSINPYMVFRRNGTMSMTPNIDTWSDDTNLPNLVTNIDTGVEALRQVADASKLLGTDYGSWIDYNTTILSSSTQTNTSASDAWRTSIQTIETKNIQTDSTRNVTTTTIGSETQSYTIDDIVKDVSIIPYIRSAIVQFYATNMKPNTRLYAYFDGVNVTSHCKSTTQISGTSNTAIFGAEPLISDADGNIIGDFRIPANMFFTGEKKFVLTNDPLNTGNADVETTRCEATYFAGGVAQTKQSSTLNVITPTFNRNVTVENKSTTSVSRDVTVVSVANNAPSVVISSVSGPNIPNMPNWEPRRNDSHFHWMFDGTRWIWDPIAQGFKVDDSCFISKVGVYFAAVDTNADIIWFEIREMVNGYPSNESIARREVKASSLSEFVTEDASKEYQVQFSVPVYVDSSKSYAFVIGGFSPDTRVFISTLGNALVDNPGVILEQPPLNYTMFRSLNGDTWNAQQFDTMKINIYRCVFDMSGTKFNFNTENINAFSMVCDASPIEMEVGLRQVRVYVKNHGLRVGDKFILDFSHNKLYEIELTGGIPQIGQTIKTSNAEGIIKDIRLNSGSKYEIMIERLVGNINIDDTFNCDSKLYEYRDSYMMSDLGVKSSVITQNAAVGKIVAVNNYELGNTIGGIAISEFTKEHIVKTVDSIDSVIIDITSAAINTGRFGSNSIIMYGNNIKYDMFNIAGQYLTYNSATAWNVLPYKATGVFGNNIDVTPLADNYVTEPGVILSYTNEQSNVGNGNSFDLTVNAKLASPYISPVFNTDSFSVTTVSNRIDNISESTYNIAPNASNRYISESNSFGSEPFKHISTKVLLSNPAVDMRIIFDVLCSNNSNIDVYVKLLNSSSDNENLVDWIKLDKYDKVRTNNNDFVEYDLLLSKHCSKWTDTTQYISYRVKLIGKGSNSSQPVIFQNLRAIALT